MRKQKKKKKEEEEEEEEEEEGNGERIGNGAISVASNTDRIELQSLHHSLQVSFR